jgi:hypothetical protein
MEFDASRSIQEIMRLPTLELIGERRVQCTVLSTIPSALAVLPIPAMWGKMKDWFLSGAINETKGSCWIWRAPGARE